MMVPRCLATPFLALGLPFTFPSTVYRVLAFSVACLVLTFMVVLFPFCVMASFYPWVAWYHPRVVIFVLPSWLLCALDAIPLALADPLFLVVYALVLLVALLCDVVGYLKKYAVEKVFSPMAADWAALEHEELAPVVEEEEKQSEETPVEVQESLEPHALAEQEHDAELPRQDLAAEEDVEEEEEVEALLDVQESPEPHALAEQDHNAELSGQDLVAEEDVREEEEVEALLEVQESPESHALAEQERDVEISGQDLAIEERVVEEEPEETLVEVQESPEPPGDDRTLVEQERDLGLSSEQHPAAERQSQDDTSKESSERDAQVQELTAKNELLEDRLQSVTNERDTIAAARQTDLEHFAQERETHETQRADLQGSLDFANTEHRIHMDHCAQERKAAAERSAEQTQELERVRQAHSTELAAVQQANEQQVSTLQARNEALEDRVVEANAARDAIAASYEAHIARTNEQAAVQETQHAALQGSLEFATTEHRIHVEHCAPARTADQMMIEELTAQLAAERAARAQDQAERDELKNQNALVNDENAALKARLAAMERAMPKDDDTPTHTQVDVAQPSTVTSSEATTYVQSESPSPDPFALALPPSTSLLFTPTKHRVLVEEFVEGSSRDGLLTPFAAGMIDGATSTPWHPPPREEHVPLPTSSSTLSDIDFDHLDYDPELMKLLRSESMESVHPSPSALGSALGSTSTRSDMSITSAAEPSHLPSSDSLHSEGYPTPPPSGSTSFWDFDSFLPSPSEFVEGSSRDGLLTPFSGGIIGATSTPWHPPSREEHVPLPTSSSTLSDTDIDRVMDKLQRSDYDHALMKLLRSESMESESFHPSSSVSEFALESTSTCSNMSLASTAELSQSPHIEIRLSLPSSDSLRSMSYPTPPPSGSTSFLDLVPSSPSPREFVEGSSRDGLLTPFSAGIIGATSTPWHPRQDQLPPSFDSRSMLSDMDITSTTDDLQQPEDDHELSELLETQSLKSFHPLLDAFTSGSTSTGSNMSIASMAERPQSPHIEIRVSLPSSDSLHSEAYPTPPPSGSTSFLDLEPEPSLPPLPSIIINDGDDISNDDGPIPPGLLAFINAPRILPPPPSPEPSISFLMPELEPSLPLPSILINDGDESSIYDGPLPPNFGAIIRAPRVLPPPPSPELSFLMPDVELSLPPPPSIIINDGDESSIYDGPLPPNFGARILPPPPPPEPSFLMPDSDSEPSLPSAPDQSGSFILEDDSSDMLSATGIQLSPSFLRPTAPRLRNESSAFSARTVPAFLRPTAPRRRPRAT